MFFKNVVKFSLWTKPASVVYSLRNDRFKAAPKAQEKFS